MKVWAMIRNRETEQIDRIEADGADYNDAREKLQSELPEGWQVLAIWSDRWHTPKIA